MLKGVKMKYLLTILLLTGCGLTEIRKDISNLKWFANDYMQLKGGLQKYLDDEEVSFYKKQEQKCLEMKIKRGTSNKKWKEIKCSSMNSSLNVKQ